MSCRAISLLLCALLPMVGSCTDPASLRIDAIIPAHADTGALVTLLGAPLDRPSLQVSFAGRAARVVYQQARRAVVEVPARLSGLVPVVISVDGSVSAPFDFWIDTAPVTDGNGLDR